MPVPKHVWSRFGQGTSGPASSREYPHQEQPERWAGIPSAGKPYGAPQPLQSSSAPTRNTATQVAHHESNADAAHAALHGFLHAAETAAKPAAEAVTKSLIAVLRADPETAVLAEAADALVKLHDKKRSWFSWNPMQPHFNAKNQMLGVLGNSAAHGLRQKIEAAFEQRLNHLSTLGPFEDKEQNYYGVGGERSSQQVTLDRREDRMRNHSAT